MNRGEANTADVDALVSAYVAAAAAHGRATEKGDYEAANQQHEILAAAYRELRERGLEAQRALLPLLSGELPVRVWVAAHALEFAPEVGEQVLVGVASGPAGPSRMDAEMTLREWRRGTLRFP